MTPAGSFWSTRTFYAESDGFGGHPLPYTSIRGLARFFVGLKPALNCVTL